MCAMLLVSCIQEIFNPETPGLGTEPDSEYVTLDVGVQMMDEPGLNVWTKALGEVPEVKDLYVAVFDAGDILTEIVKAVPGTVQEENDDFEPEIDPQASTQKYRTHFHVTLKKTEEPREVQFIAIGQKDFIDVDNFDRVDEASFIKSFIVSDNVDAYWCRKSFPHGISASSSSAMQNLKMIRNFLKVTVSVAENVNNFTLSGFRVFNKPRYGTLAPYNPNTDEYNFPTTGSREYATSVNFDRFADYSRIEMPENTGGDLEDTNNEAYKELVESQKYTGYMPSTVEYVSMNEAYAAEQASNPGNTWTDIEDWFANTMITGAECDYLYECTYTDADNPFIIFKGSYNGGPETYYKADFVYQAKAGADKIYFHLLRNFFYELHITHVSSDGATTLEAAVNSPSMNNFDGSTAAQSYTVISKDAARLYISTTDMLVVNGTTAKVYLKNLLKPEGASDFTQLDNGSISVSKVTKCINAKDVNQSELRSPLIAYSRYTGDYLTDDEAYQAAIDTPAIFGQNVTAENLESNASFVGGFAIEKTDEDATFNGSPDWVEYTITLARNPSELGNNDMWQQSITFSNGEGGLTRTLLLSARKPYDFRVDAQDLVAKTEGTTMTVDIILPSGISEARFPLKFLIEPYDHNLYPDASSSRYPILPVISGTSLITAKRARNERSYWFERTITYEEYAAAPENIQSEKTFTSYFKTLVAASATSVYVVCDSDSSPYFANDPDHQVSDRFVNDAITGTIRFGRRPLNVGVGGKATNPVSVNSGAPVSYSVEDVSVATVNATTGEVNGVSAGETTVRATVPAAGAYTGASASYRVVVVPVLPDWSFDWSGLVTPVVKVGQSVTTNTAVAALHKSSGDVDISSSITYRLEDPETSSIATVDAATGAVTGVAAGVVTIVAQIETPPYEDNGTTYSSVSEDIMYTIEVVDGRPTAGTEYISVPFTDGKMLWFNKDTYEDFCSWNFRSDMLSIGIQAQPTDRTLTPARDVNSHSWLISDVFDLRAAVNPVLAFTHAGNWWTKGYVGDGTYGDDNQEYVPALSAEAEDEAHSLSQAKVRMMQDALVKISFDGGTSWSEGTLLSSGEYPSGYDWTTVNVRHSLKSLLTGKTDEQLKNVRIAFEYWSRVDTKPSDPHDYRPWAGTWQIRNVRIVEEPE